MPDMKVQFYLSRARIGPDPEDPSSNLREATLIWGLRNAGNIFNNVSVPWHVLEPELTRVAFVGLLATTARINAINAALPNSAIANAVRILPWHRLSRGKNYIRRQGDFAPFRADVRDMLALMPEVDRDAVRDQLVAARTWGQCLLTVAKTVNPGFNRFGGMVREHPEYFGD